MAFTDTHPVAIATPDGDCDDYVVSCAACSFEGSTDTYAAAEAVARLHEEFLAVLVDAWEARR